MASLQGSSSVLNFSFPLDILIDRAGNFSLGIIKSEQPNNSLYTYEGTLQVNGNTIPLDPSQLLLRVGVNFGAYCIMGLMELMRHCAEQGAMLKNTRWVYAIVVFTGHESKLMRNAT